MFETLSERLNKVFNQLRKRGKLSTSDVDESLREVKLALLEADVHYSVVKDLISRIRERSIGAEVSKALNPAQQVIKIVNEELVAVLGQPEGLVTGGTRPRVIMLVGLQGSGKTTAAGKLASLLRSKGERVMLVAGDPYRPAAIDQLQILGKQVDVLVVSETSLKPPQLVRMALEKAQKGGFSVMIVDTAGRSQLDAALMDELKQIIQVVPPADTLLVVDAMTGQEALNIAQGFKSAIPLTGLILTKMDGDARGGAAISVRAVTGVPIKFLGTGEKLDALEVYNPERLASRILGMGDILGLIEKAETAFDAEQARSQAEKLTSGEFNLEDLAEIMRSTRKMGPMSQMMEMLPNRLGQQARDIPPEQVDRQVKQTEAIISSMTVLERRHPDLLNASRRRRIARGSGTEVQDVNRLMKQYLEMQRLFKMMKKSGGRGLSRLFG